MVVMMNDDGDGGDGNNDGGNGDGDDDPLPYKIIHTNKNSTILVCMILNGKGLSNWLWSTWIQSCFLPFLAGQSIIVFFLLILLCICCSSPRQ